MDPNHDNEQADPGQPVDLDSAIDQLEDLLNNHDEELHPAAGQEDGEEDIPVLLDVVEDPEIGRHGLEPPATPPPGPDAGPGGSGLEPEPMLPFEFIDDITPERDPEPGPRPVFPPQPEADAPTPETDGPASSNPDLDAGQVHPGELSPQLLDELEGIIDRELQRVTAAAKQSILATLRAHLDESGQAELDLAIGARGTGRFPAATPDSDPLTGPEGDNPPLRPFDPFNDPD